MSFYGPPRKDLSGVMSGLQSVEDIYENTDLSTFMHDNLVALMRNQHFFNDTPFTTAVIGNAENDRDTAKIWRLHTCCWAARTALALDGNFVECGTYKGFYASVIAQYLRFDTLQNKFYLFDTFEGLSPNWSSEKERIQADPGYEWDGTYDDVLNRFSIYSNFQVVKGVVPEVFDDVLPERIAFLHLDLNAAAAETAAAERLLPQLLDGAIVVLDDFGRQEQNDLCYAHLAWWGQQGQTILELPTGQGLVVYRQSH